MLGSEDSNGFCAATSAVLGPDVSCKPEVAAEGRGETVLDDCEDFRFVTTGLFLALAWNTVFVRFAFGAASDGGLTVSSLLTLCSVSGDSPLLSGILSLSASLVDVPATTGCFVEYGPRSSVLVLSVLPDGVVDGVLSSSPSAERVLCADTRDASVLPIEVTSWGLLSIGGSLVFSFFSSSCEGEVGLALAFEVPDGGGRTCSLDWEVFMAALRFLDTLGDCVGVVRRGPSSEIALKCRASWLPVRWCNIFSLPQTLQRKFASL